VGFGQKDAALPEAYTVLDIIQQVHRVVPSN
jgi:hypothetical protein